MRKSTLVFSILATATALAAAQGTSTATSSASGNAGAQAAGMQCGGVGQADQDRMKAEAARHGLLVTFATTSGAYLADADVVVRHAGRTVVQGHCGGPLMLLDLAPAGSYEIAATLQGRTERKTVTVGGRPASVTFTWPGG